MSNGIETSFLRYLPETPKLDLVISALTADLERGDAGFTWINGPTALKVLLSDYAITAATTCSQSVKEAALHLQEHESALGDRLGVFKAYAQGLVEAGQPVDLDPPSEERDLADLRRNIHMVGFFRAIGTALDNVGAMASIVGGLPICVVENFTFPKLIWNMNLNAKASHQASQDDLIMALGRCSSLSEPDGWLEWSLEMRNMLVHRPRRLWFITTGLSNPSTGQRNSDWSYMLPRSPEWSDVEMWRSASQIGDNFVPQESSVILNGVLSNTSTLVEELSTEVSKLIFLRRSNPDILIQPLDQWRKTVLPATSKAGNFHGFGPPREMTNTDSISLSQIDHARMRSASFFDAEARNRWVVWLAELTFAIEALKEKRRRAKEQSANSSKRRGPNNVAHRSANP